MHCGSGKSHLIHCPGKRGLGLPCEVGADEVVLAKGEEGLVGEETEMFKVLGRGDLLLVAEVAVDGAEGIGEADHAEIGGGSFEGMEDLTGGIGVFSGNGLL